MSKAQAEHFRQILHSWKRDLMVEVDRTVTHMKDEAATSLIRTTAPPRRRSSPWNCAPVIASAS